MAAQPPASPPAVTGPPLPPSPTPPRDDIDLDTHIAVVEQRLVSREQRVMGQAQDLSRRVGRLVAPRALLLKAGGAVLAVAGLAWTLRRSGPHSPGRSPPAAPVPAAGAAPLLLSLLPMAWPLLPDRWHGRMNPATVATLLGVAAPMVERCLARRRAVSASLPAASGNAGERASRNASHVASHDTRDNAAG